MDGVGVEAGAFAETVVFLSHFCEADARSAECRALFKSRQNPVSGGALPSFMSLVGVKPDLAFARRNVAAAAAAIRAQAPGAGPYLPESGYLKADWRRAY